MSQSSTLTFLADVAALAKFGLQVELETLRTRVVENFLIGRVDKHAKVVFVAIGFIVGVEPVAFVAQPFGVDLT